MRVAIFWRPWLRRALRPLQARSKSRAAITRRRTLTAQDVAPTLPAAQQRWLMATITFSNLPYAGDDDPRRDEAFDFHFPGVRFDRAQRAFFASSRRGELIQWRGFAAARLAVGLIWARRENVSAERKAAASLRF